MKNSLINRTVQVLALCCMRPDIILACSGPGASELIEHNGKVVMIYGAIGLALILTTIAFYFLRLRKGIPLIIASLVFAFFHPIWRYGGGGGDCGVTMVETAKYVTIILVVPLMIQVALWKFRKPDFQASRTEHPFNR